MPDTDGVLRMTMPTRAALATMGAEQLRELSAAASMLASLADEEMSTR
jgi:hypothetical protein